MSKLKKYQNKQTGEIVESDAEPTERGNFSGKRNNGVNNGR